MVITHPYGDMRLESEIVKIGQNSSHKAGFFKKRSKAGLCYDQGIVPAYRIRVHPLLIKCTQDDFLIEQEIEHTFRAE